MKILVIDDHAIVRSGLRRILASRPEMEVIEAATALGALQSVQDHAPDVIVLDINLPGMGGLELLRRLATDKPAPRIVILSMHVDAIYVEQALAAGALGYVSKAAPPHQIVEAILRVADGESFIEHAIAQEMALRSVRGGSLPTHGLLDLNPRETEFLRLLGQGKSHAEMSEALGISYKTIANTKSLLKAKLGMTTTSELIRLAIKGGIAEL